MSLDVAIDGRNRRLSIRRREWPAYTLRTFSAELDRERPGEACTPGSHSARRVIYPPRPFCMKVGYVEELLAVLVISREGRQGLET